MGCCFLLVNLLEIDFVVIIIIVRNTVRFGILLLILDDLVEDTGMSPFLMCRAHDLSSLDIHNGECIFRLWSVFRSVYDDYNRIR